MKLRQMFALTICLLFPALAFPQAQPNLTLVRVQYMTRKNTVNPQGELKAKIQELDAHIAEAARYGRSGELRRLFAKGTVLLTGKEWTPELDYANSLALRTGNVVSDSIPPYPLRIEQIYLPAINLERPLTALVTLRKRSMAQQGEIVKDFGSFEGVGRDLRESPYQLSLDMSGVADGPYQLNLEVSNGTAKLGTSVLNIVLRKGLNDLVARLESEAKAAPENLRAEILFPIDRMRSVNRGTLELRTFDPDKDFQAAESVAAAVKAHQDPYAKRTGDFKRHYLLAPVGEVMPYELHVPAAYDGARAFPLIVALHGLGGTEDAFFQSYEKKLPVLAEQHGYIIAAPLGYRVDGSYGWGLAEPPADSIVRRTQELSEKDVMEVMQQVQSNYKIDKNRVYLMGHSMGGIGTWKLAAKYPDLWAAIAPIAGMGQPSTIEKFRTIPEIVVHGDNDKTVPVAGSRLMVAKMKELGVEVKYIEVPGGSHGDVVAPNFAAILDFFDAHKKLQ